MGSHRAQSPSDLRTSQPRIMKFQSADFTNLDFPPSGSAKAPPPARRPAARPVPNGRPSPPPLPPAEALGIPPRLCLQGVDGKHPYDIRLVLGFRRGVIRKGLDN